MKQELERIKLNCTCFVHKHTSHSTPNHIHSPFSAHREKISIERFGCGRMAGRECVAAMPIFSPIEYWTSGDLCAGLFSRIKRTKFIRIAFFALNTINQFIVLLENQSEMSALYCYWDCPVMLWSSQSLSVLRSLSLSVCLALRSRFAIAPFYTYRAHTIFECKNSYPPTNIYNKCNGNINSWSKLSSRFWMRWLYENVDCVQCTRSTFNAAFSQCVRFNRSDYVHNFRFRYSPGNTPNSKEISEQTATRQLNDASFRFS